MEKIQKEERRAAAYFMRQGMGNYFQSIFFLNYENL